MTEKRVMIADQKVSHVWVERNQKIEELMSLRSRRRRARWDGTLKKRRRSKSGTPRACALNGAAADLGLGAIVRRRIQLPGFYSFEVCNEIVL